MPPSFVHQGFVRSSGTRLSLGVLGLLLAPLASGQDAKPSAEAAGKWQAAASMNIAREYAGGVLLKNGKVLAVSGHPLKGESIASAEIHDPATDRWELTGSLHEARNGGDGATLLLDGRVLLAGDHGKAGGALAGVEIFDPRAGSWTRTGSLARARGVHTTTLLRDGKVLVAGGIDWGTEEVFSSAELYDPAAGTWSSTGAMTRSRFSHRAVRLADGRVLALGGYEKYPGGGTATAEVYEPEKATWRVTRPMLEVRSGFVAVVLRDGRVLVAGGKLGAAGEVGKTVLASAEIYHPGKEEWEKASPMAVPRAMAAATLLADGRVLLSGGVASDGLEVASAEILDPVSGAWISAGAMTTPRRNHRATVLADGSVFILGGSNFFGRNYLNSTERFLPSAPLTEPRPTADGNRKRRLGVLIYPGFELLDVYGPLEMWGNLKPLIEVVVVASSPGEVASSQGPRTVADFGFADCPPLDLVLVPGGFGAVPLLKDAATLDWVRARAESAEIVLSVCNGASILAAAGLLDGQRATTNKAYWDLATAPGPRVNWVRRARWVDSGKFVTSSGVSAGIDMSLAVIARLFGRAAATGLANGTEYEWHEDPTWDPFAELHAGDGEKK